MNALRRATPTRRAWALSGVGTAFIVAGRTLALKELFPIGLTAVVLVLLSWLVVALQPIDLRASRRLVPSRMHAGGPGRVDLDLTSTGTSPTPVLCARDPFDGGRRHARFRVAPIQPGQTVHAAYRVPTDRRGVFPVGPLEVLRTDPLGLLERRVEVLGADTLTVYPPIDRIAALPHTRGQDPRGGTIARPALGVGGDDFYALRPYVLGDDLRRVHWASTARLDELMIRQDQLPWQGRVVVSVDVRAEVHTEATFEAAMSAAASICVACAADRVEVRLVGTDGVDTGFGGGRGHVEVILERLAGWTADTDRTRTLTRALAALGRGNDAALAVVTTGRAGAAALEAAARARTGRSGTTTVVFEDGSGGKPPVTGGIVLRCSGRNGFVQAWEASFGPAPHRLTELVL